MKVSVGPSQAAIVIGYAKYTETAAGMCLKSYNALQVMTTARLRAN